MSFTLLGGRGITVGSGGGRVITSLTRPVFRFFVSFDI